MLLPGDCDAAFRIRGNGCNIVPFIILCRAGSSDRCYRPSEEGHVCTTAAGIGRAKIADFYRCGTGDGFAFPGGHKLCPAGIGHWEGSGAVVILVVENDHSVVFINCVQIDRAVFGNRHVAKVKGLRR